MTVTVIVEDNLTDGAAPVKANICIDNDTKRVMVDFGDYSILIPREELEIVLNEDLHG